MSVRKRSKTVRRAPKRRRSLTARVEVLEGEMTRVKADLAALRGVPAQLLRLQNEFDASSLNVTERFAHVEALFIERTEHVLAVVEETNDKLMMALGGLPCTQHLAPSDTQPYEPLEVKK